MADKKEPETKKRGRPRKEVAPVANEEKQVITMTQQAKSPSSQALDAGVGTVRDVMSTPITLDSIQHRWQNIFSKYSSLGADGIISAWRENSWGTAALNNPFIQNRRVKQISSTPLKITKEELNNALLDPENHEQVLRSASNWLAYTNYVYQTLIQLNRDTGKYLCYANPLYLENHSKEKLREDSERVDKILKKFNAPSTFKDIATQVFLEGKSSYLIRTSYSKNDINYLLLQKLNSDNVKITGFGSKQKFIVSFNMVVFLQPGYSPEQYPEFIQDAWAEMVNQGIIIEDKRGNKKVNPKANIPQGHILETLMDGSYMYWIQLPQDLAVTFYSNGAHPNAFPDTLGLFNDLIALDDWRWLQGQIASQTTAAVMTAEVPYTKDAKTGADQTVCSVDTLLGFTDMFNQIVGGNISGFFAPFTDYKLHYLETNPDSLNVVYDRTRDLVATSGNSALLSVSDKPSISATNTARMIQEAKVDYLTKQFEAFLNNVINDNFGLNYQWHVTVHGGIFNWREDAKMTKELVLQGTTSLLPRLLSYYDMTLEDYHGATIYMEDLGITISKDSQSNATANATTESNPVGRPKANIDEIESDATGQSIDAGSNVSEIKEYELEQLQELLDSGELEIES